MNCFSVEKAIYAEKVEFMAINVSSVVIRQNREQTTVSILSKSL